MFLGGKNQLEEPETRVPRFSGFLKVTRIIVVSQQPAGGRDLTRGTRCVRCVFSVCSVCVQCVFSVCSVCVLSVCSVCVQCVFSVFSVCSRPQREE